MNESASMMQNMLNRCENCIRSQQGFDLMLGIPNLFRTKRATNYQLIYLVFT
jgi:hypothetical protein